MIRQQINLYQQAAKERGLSFNAATMSIGIVAFSVLMLVVSIWQSDKASQLEDQLAQLKRNETELSQRIDDIRKSIPTNQRDSLENHRVKLQAKLDELKQIGELMARQEQTPSQGFAAQLAGLAKHHMNGISLQQIQLLKGGRYIELAGDSRPAEAIPQYLQRLQDEPSFKGSTFGALQLRRDEQRHDIMNFRLSNREEGAL